jgi:hypothetical protein
VELARKEDPDEHPEEVTPAVRNVLDTVDLN